MHDFLGLPMAKHLGLVAVAAPSVSVVEYGHPDYTEPEPSPVPPWKEYTVPKFKELKEHFDMHFGDLVDPETDMLV